MERGVKSFINSLLIFFMNSYISTTGIKMDCPERVVIQATDLLT